ncbi:unnamed protein product, partial [marine sediment metagenome]
LCDEILTRKLRILWSDSAGLYNMNSNLVSKLRDAGCIKLWVGVESPSGKIMKFVGKNIHKLGIAEIRNRLRMIHKVGIWVGVSLIVGMPYETESDLRTMCNFIQDCNEFVDVWQINKLQIKANSLFMQKPSDYRIEIIYDSQKNGLGFNEIQGLKWEDKQKQQNDFFQRVVSIIGGNLYSLGTLNNVMGNDHLVFFLYRQLHSKINVRKWINSHFSAGGEYNFKRAPTRKVFVEEKSFVEDINTGFLVPSDTMLEKIISLC